MCTLVAFVGVWSAAPLLVAANRDERLDRASSGPRRWPGEDFVAPRDEEAGGTWLGLHRSGLFVGVTNRAGTSRDSTRSSRGSLVVEALRMGSARRVHEAFAGGALDGRRYNPFHLFYADGSDAFVTWFDGAAVQGQTVPAGLAVVTERSLGGDDRGRTERIRGRLAPLLSRGAPPPSRSSPRRCANTTRRTGSRPPASTSPSLGYGTRSSLLLDVRRDAKDTRWLWAHGPPCVTPYSEVSLDWA